MGETATAAEKIHEYMLEQNRPYSLTDIHLNMHKQHGKTLLQRAVDLLTQQGRLTEKIYGKQKVYVTCQNSLARADPAQLKAMDDTILSVRGKLEVVQDQLRSVETELKQINNSMTLQQAEQTLKQCEAEISEKTAKVAALRANCGKYDEREMSRVRDSCAKLSREWRRRKRMACDMLDTVLESYPKSKRELLQETGVETDEEAGVSLPNTAA